MVVCDHETGDVVYAYSYDGSINDKNILSSIYYQMQSVGIDLTNNIAGVQGEKARAYDKKHGLKASKTRRCLIRRPEQRHPYIRFR